ncbi:MAG: flagellar basal body L-ring protein FlgH [Deltaproteobacteria bacterium]|nr:flagellar basal body L-ring protein FlgH [Deltaproteobacteria bacterium]
MRVKTPALIIAACLVVSLAGCEPRHIKAYTPRHRVYEPGQYAADESDGGVYSGSLYSTSTPSLFEDLRASRVGDILTVVIDEESKGKGDASTKLGKSSGIESGVVNFLGLMAGITERYPDMDPTALIKLMSKSDFKGEGETSRNGKLEGMIAVRVENVMPNGDLFIEGHKVILLNEEELHFYVSGVIRQLDVNPENSVRSSLIADAQVEFSGRGVVSDQQSPGWLHRLIDAYSPI